MSLDVSIIKKRLPEEVERDKKIADELFDISKNLCRLAKEEGVRALDIVDQIESLADEYVGNYSHTIYSGNITHNLTSMAKAVSEDFYKALWRPNELFDRIEGSEVLAQEIIPFIEVGLKELRSNKEKYEVYNAPNRWGMYDDLVRFVYNYLYKLIENPDALVVADR
jgi:hypothetical protein